MKVLKKKKILSSIIRVGGASVGAINALLLGLNYSPEEAEKILMKMDISNFLDFPCIVKFIYRINKEFGLCRGNKFHRAFALILRKKLQSLGTKLNRYPTILIIFLLILFVLFQLY